MGGFSFNRGKRTTKKPFSATTLVLFVAFSVSSFLLHSLNASAENRCDEGGVGGPTISKNFQPSFGIRTPNPPSIAPNSAAKIYVEGGTPNYTWSLTDPPAAGYSIEPGTTTNQATVISNSCPDPIVGVQVEDNTGQVETAELIGPASLEYVYPEAAGQEATSTTSATVAISGGVPPYTYELSNQKFSFNQNSPVHTLENTTATAVSVWNLNDEGCGGTDVTITDSCGDSVYGYVRGSTGQWVTIGTNAAGYALAQTAGMAGSYDNWWRYRNHYYFNRTLGRYKLHEELYSVARYGFGTCTGDYCVGSENNTEWPNYSPLLSADLGCDWWGAAVGRNYLCGDGRRCCYQTWNSLYSRWMKNTRDYYYQTLIFKEWQCVQ